MPRVLVPLWLLPDGSRWQLAGSLTCPFVPGVPANSLQAFLGTMLLGGAAPAKDRQRSHLGSLICKRRPDRGGTPQSAALRGLSQDSLKR